MSIFQMLLSIIYIVMYIKFANTSHTDTEDGIKMIIHSCVYYEMIALALVSWERSLFQEINNRFNIMTNHWIMRCKRSIQHHWTSSKRATNADTIAKSLISIRFRHFSATRCRAKRMYIIKEQQSLRGSRKVSNSQSGNWAIFLDFVYATMVMRHSQTLLSKVICIVNSKIICEICRKSIQRRKNIFLLA